MLDKFLLEVSILGRGEFVFSDLFGVGVFGQEEECSIGIHVVIVEEEGFFIVIAFISSILYFDLVILKRIEFEVQEGRSIGTDERHGMKERDKILV